MIRRVGLALANLAAWCYVAPIFWLSKYADPYVCAWTEQTAGDDER